MHKRTKKTQESEREGKDGNKKGQNLEKKTMERIGNIKCKSKRKGKKGMPAACRPSIRGGPRKPAHRTGPCRLRLRVAGFGFRASIGFRFRERKGK